MKRTGTTRTSGLALVLASAALVAAAESARADPIWTYEWQPASQVITTQTGGVTLTAIPTGQGQGSMPVTAAQITTFASQGTPGETVSNGAYNFTMTLTDQASNQSAQLAFAGNLSGTFNASTASLQNQVTLAVQKAQLGAYNYTVTLDGYSAPGAPGGKIGSLSAHVVVQAAALQTPEPSTLLLAGCGLPGLALFRAWRRRCRPSPC